ncbi:replication initiator protein [Flyfo microvirus Tbat2_93]|nr:replication initiator protein [Flyfo microvirus Tbat2_93]
MCKQPTYTWVHRGPKWEKQPVPCRKCWQCQKDRLNDYVGRSLAEAATSQVTAAVTLTYAPRDDLADKVIHPRHFQLFMKLLRRAGHKVRYLVAGEYGDTKGRAHFHAILFFEDLVPLHDQFPLYDAGIVPVYKDDYPQGVTQENAPFCREIAQMRMVHCREWPHGHIQVDWNGDEKAIRYVCKYLLKADKNQAWFSLSKKPPLGFAWFMEKAEIARDLGVLPVRFEYHPPGGDKNRTYYLTGASRREFLNAITTDPADKPRMSDWTKKTFEKHERARLMDDLNSLPVEDQEQAWIDRKEREEEQKRLMRFGRELREAGNLDDLVAQSENGVLRKKDGKWSPNVKEKPK